jgi:hypothetical protein
VAAKVREKLPISKQVVQKFNVEGFNLKKLKEVELKEKYQVKIANTFAALETLGDGNDDHADINRSFESIRENIKASSAESPAYYELKQHKPRFHEDCSCRIQAKQIEMI